VAVVAVFEHLFGATVKTDARSCQVWPSENCACYSKRTFACSIPVLQRRNNNGAWSLSFHLGDPSFSYSQEPEGSSDNRSVTIFLPRQIQSPAYLCSVHSSTGTHPHT